MTVPTRLDLLDSTGYSAMQDANSNFANVWPYLAEIENARDGESTVLAKMNAIDANIATLTVGTGCPVSSNDTTPGYLNGKLVAGSGIELVEGNDGGNETLTVSAADMESMAFFYGIHF